MDQNDTSPAVQLLQLVWDHRNGGRPYPTTPWEYLNGAMAEALALAITTGLEFHLEDFKIIRQRFRSGYWIGHDCERFYSMAATGNRWSNRVYRPNVSACVAWEHYRDRKPFYLYRPSTNRTERVRVGMQFTWKATAVRCTSFAEDGLSLIACQYAEPTGQDLARDPVNPERKPIHRHRINHRDLRTYNKQRRPKKEETS